MDDILGPCPVGECRPIDETMPFGHGRTCPDCPHVVYAICGARAEIVSPDELQEAWDAMLRARPLPGQTSWLE